MASDMIRRIEEFESYEAKLGKMTEPSQPVVVVERVEVRPERAECQF